MRGLYRGRLILPFGSLGSDKCFDGLLSEGFGTFDDDFDGTVFLGDFAIDEDDGIRDPDGLGSLGGTGEDEGFDPAGEVFDIGEEHRFVGFG